eukprot:TRINITY_DN49299_c0_g1_i1.p1 TRINITY_DN49299_c0_g1~~TRINITY_DN49299_c0_g1_i1.p1  ORF type:complete len:338 (+),score=30.09 TRINITY_DN49299_c0_g1_i1:27-1040(+)
MQCGCHDKLKQSLREVEAALQQDTLQREHLRETVKEIDEIKARWLAKTTEPVGDDPRSVRIRELELCNKELLDQLRQTTTQLDIIRNATSGCSPSSSTSPTSHTPSSPSPISLFDTSALLPLTPVQGQVYTKASAMQESAQKTLREELQEARALVGEQKAKNQQLQKRVETMEDEHRNTVDVLQQELLQCKSKAQQAMVELEALVAYKDSLANGIKLQRSLVSFAVCLCLHCWARCQSLAAVWPSCPVVVCPLSTCCARTPLFLHRYTHCTHKAVQQKKSLKCNKTMTETCSASPHVLRSWQRSRRLHEKKAMLMHLADLFGCPSPQPHGQQLVRVL